MRSLILSSLILLLNVSTPWDHYNVNNAHNVSLYHQPHIFLRSNTTPSLWPSTGYEAPANFPSPNSASPSSAPNHSHRAAEGITSAFLPGSGQVVGQAEDVERQPTSLPERILDGKKQAKCPQCMNWIGLGCSKDYTPVNTHMKGRNCVGGREGTFLILVVETAPLKPRTGQRSQREAVNLVPSSQQPRSQWCPGTLLRWNAGPFFNTYPLSIHSPDSPHNPGYSLMSVNDNGSVVRIKADRCTEVVSDGQPCIMCLGLSVFVDVVHDRAQYPVDRARKLKDSQLSHSQLSACLDSSIKAVDKFRFTVRLSLRSVGTYLH